MTHDPAPDDHETSDETRRRLEVLKWMYEGESGEERWRPRLGTTFTMEDVATASGQCLFFFYGYRRSFPMEPREAEKRAWDAAKQVLSVSIEQTWRLIKAWTAADESGQEPPYDAICHEINVQAIQMEILGTALDRARWADAEI